jgi:predicted Zn-dependent peptidase
MIESTVLENGIRVTTERMPGSRSIAVGILVSAGPRDEQDDKAGLAHLTEHALFHGTSCRSELEISRLIDTVGGKVSAFTGRDYTCYSAVVMDDNLTYILDLFSDMLLNSIFPEERLEYEKQVILTELASGRDLPHERVMSLLKSSVWPEHALGRDIEGKAEGIQGLTREDVIYFLHGNYLPNRISIAMAGNLQHEDVVAKVHDCLWRLFGHADRTIVHPGPFLPGTYVEECMSMQAYFALGIPAPSYTDADRYGIHLLSAILGGGLSSRLYRNLREEQGLVYDIHSEYHAYLDAGMVVVSGSTLPDHLEKTIGLVVEETMDMFSLARPPHFEEIWQAQLRTVGQHHIDSEDPYMRMSRLLTQLYYFDRVIPAGEIVDNLRGIDQESLVGICRKSFPSVRDHLALAIVGPSCADGEIVA